MNAGALGRAWNIVGRIGGGEHFVNNVDDTVAGVDVGDGDVGTVDHHAITDGEGQGLTVDGFGRHAVGKGR